MVRLALAQFPAEIDVQPNLDAIAGYAERAAAHGANLLVLPELSSTIYPAFANSAQLRALAEPADGPAAVRVQKVARACDLTIVYPFFELGEGDRCYSSALLVGPCGNVLGHCRKAHIPRMELFGSGREDYYFSPGDLPYTAWDTPLGIKIGILICYDRYFPEGPRVLALKGADLLVVPSVAAPVGRRWWELMFRAHAVQNSCFVAGVNKAGTEKGGAPVNWYGHSLLVDPEGEVVVQAGAEPGMVTADVDLSQLAAVRQRLHFIKDRRPDLCGELTE